MSSEDGGNRLYTTGEIALLMAIVSLVLLIPILAGLIYYVGWL